MYKREQKMEMGVFITDKIGKNGVCLKITNT